MLSKTGISRTGLGSYSPSLTVGGFDCRPFAHNRHALNTLPGHAGGETAKHVAENLPGQLQSALVGLLVESEWRINSVSISNLLSEVITSYDDSLMKDLYDLFPGGVEELNKLSDDEVKAVIRDSTTGGSNHAKVALCMQGSTVLLSLLDPNHDNVWVASLGDCQAGVSRVLFFPVQEPVLNDSVECWVSAPTTARVGTSPSSVEITTLPYPLKSRHSVLHILGNLRSS